MDVCGGAGPTSESESESRAISSGFLGGCDCGGRVGPIDRGAGAGAGAGDFAMGLGFCAMVVGGREGPIGGPIDGPNEGPFGTGAQGPKPSSESSSSKGISSSFSRRDTLVGGEAFDVSASSSGVRFRFCRCGGSWGPMEAIMQDSVREDGNKKQFWRVVHVLTVS